jgi:hypothetical protein
VPVSSALGVAGLVLGVSAVSGPSALGGPTPDERRPDPPALPHDVFTPGPLPPAGPPTRKVVITGFRTEGRVLSVFYTVDVRDCTGQIRPPVVRETTLAVTVTLRRRAGQPPVPQCGQLTLRNTVDVRLDRPLAGRLIRDGARGGELVAPRDSVP